jgi:hypothetical protein
MTSAQHIASHVAAHTRSLGADLSAQAGRLWSAGTAQIARTAGYTVMSLYAAGFVAYVAAAF